MRRRDFIRAATGVGAAAGLAACGSSSSGNSAATTSATTAGAPGTAASAGTSASAGASSGTGAGSGAGAATGNVNVSFQQFGSSHIQANFLAGVVKTFQAANPKAKVNLQPILASENDYYTKLELAMRSPRTSCTRTRSSSTPTSPPGTSPLSTTV